MHNLFILRAAPATGKSTWVEMNSLQDITVSSDEWRLKLFGIIYDENGQPSISQEKPWIVWGKVKEDIAHRMEYGEDIILDACARSTKDINTWQQLATQNNYTTYVVEFYHDVDRGTCKTRNAEREDFRRVPDFVIDNFYDSVMDNPVPEWCYAITPEEALMLLFSDEECL